MPSSTYIHAMALHNDLKGAKGAVSWQIGLVVNLLLERAKEQVPDSLTLSVLGPLQPDADDAYVAFMDTSDVRAILGQIVTSTNPHLELEEALD